MDLDQDPFVRGTDSDPDPNSYQNVTDPQHWLHLLFISQKMFKQLLHNTETLCKLLFLIKSFSCIAIKMREREEGHL